MKKNNKKHLPLLLLALLMISVGAYGTRAYFTDSAEQEAGIKLNMGDLEISSATPETDDWEYVGVNKSLGYKNDDGIHPITINTPIIEEQAKNIVNVQPGDKFSKKFTFQNTGSLHQYVTINPDIKRNDDELIITLSTEDGKFNDIEIIPNEFIDVTVTVEVPYIEDGEKHDVAGRNTSRTDDNIFDLIEEQISVTASQQVSKQ